MVALHASLLPWTNPKYIWIEQESDKNMVCTELQIDPPKASMLKVIVTSAAIPLLLTSKSECLQMLAGSNDFRAHNPDSIGMMYMACMLT